MILTWDEPNNAKFSEDVTSYDIRYRPNNWLKTSYDTTTVNAPTTSVLLKSGFNCMERYHFGVRARNADFEGEWNTISEFTGTFYIFCCKIEHVAVLGRN